jgi:LAO/AO transport system kinase
MLFTIEDINFEISKGIFLKLAKTISGIENKEVLAAKFLESMKPSKVPIIGITGPPGAGKSTLISAMINVWVGEGKKIAVLTVDPSSPFHKGAILGDRIRMRDWYMHPNVFIRSFASRGHLGGLTSAMIELTTLLQSLNFDIIVLETVGVGQSEVEIADLADTTIVVLIPDAGDDVQMMKSGLMEIADLFVVNKSDRPAANTFLNHLQKMIQENNASMPAPKVISTIASQNMGIIELVEEVYQHQHLLEKSSDKLNSIMAKVIQIIIGKQLDKLDQEDIKTRLAIAIEEEHFNLFNFAKQITDH